MEVEATLSDLIDDSPSASDDDSSLSTSISSNDDTMPSEVILQATPSSSSSTSNPSTDHLSPPSPLPLQAESTDAVNKLQPLLEKWTPQLTVQQLRSFMAAKQIDQAKSKELRKGDLVKLIVAHYLEKSWEQFKADLGSSGIHMKGIDLQLE